MARLIFGSKSLNKLVKRRQGLQRVLQAAEGVLLSALWHLAARLPVEWASAVGRWLLRLLGPRLDKTRIIRQNLMLAFPRHGEAQREALIRNIWGCLGALLAEYPHLAEIVEQGDGSRIELVISPAVEAFHEPRKPVIFVSVHQSNWELSAAAVAALGVPLSVFYTPLQNPRLDHLVARSRGTLRFGTLPRDASMRTVMRELRGGTSIGFVMDQRVDGGQPVPFFGMDKMTTVIPARLALRHGCQLVPVRVQRTGNVRYRVTLCDPVVPWDDSADESTRALQMTHQVNTQFEEWIRAHPEEWVCTKRRWAKNRLAAASVVAQQRAA